VRDRGLEPFSRGSLTRQLRDAFRDAVVQGGPPTATHFLRHLRIGDSGMGPHARNQRLPISRCRRQHVVDVISTVAACKLRRGHPMLRSEFGPCTFL
jgi:hypothetical protein